ncbi:uncharacterized protein [Drosophila takahashii]|uniref:uncharacterized protein n=1 Tax=Drosophila takahashii TaxID=29030 RepID=UPI001CF8AA40|nr:uncharacterized protein LOC108060113 [Drosophila takahashii]
MLRSVLLLLIAALVLSAAIAVPTSRLETEELEADEHSQLLSNEDLGSSNEKSAHMTAAKVGSSSSEEFKDSADAEDDVTENIDSSVESSSGEEQKPENAAEVDGSGAIAVRRRRSDERYRNLNLLATICPQADTSSLEEGSSLDQRIEIKDMYAICASLPKTG